MLGYTVRCHFPKARLIMNKQLYFWVCLVCVAIFIKTNNIFTMFPSQARYIATALVTKSALEQKKIAFVSERDGFSVIYVMNEDGSDQRPLEINSKGAFVDYPQWSASGEKMVFSLSYGVGLGQTEVHIINQDISTKQVIKIQNSNIAAHPAISQDGLHITYMTSQDGRFRVYVMNSDGSHQHRLTNLEANNTIALNDQTEPQWSPAENTIAFLSQSDTAPAELKLVNYDGSGLQTLVQNTLTFTWSPDGQFIAYVSSNSADSGKLCLINVKSHVQNCPSALENVLGLGIRWSPDGKHIAFSGSHNNGYDIFIWDIETNQVRRLTDNSGYINYRVPTNYDPTWSPDGQRLIFVASDDIVAVSTRTARIYAINVDGSNLLPLTATGDMSFWPAWQP